MMAILRLVFAAATIALVGLAGYHLIERNQAPEEAAVEAADPDVTAMRDMRKKARAASKQAIAEGCTGLSAAPSGPGVEG